MKNSKIMGIHWKIQFLGGGGGWSRIDRRELPKKVGLRVNCTEFVFEFFHWNIRKVAPKYVVVRSVPLLLIYEFCSRPQRILENGPKYPIS